MKHETYSFNKIVVKNPDLQETLAIVANAGKDPDSVLAVIHKNKITESVMRQKSYQPFLFVYHDLQKDLSALGDDITNRPQSQITEVIITKNHF